MTAHVYGPFTVCLGLFVQIAEENTSPLQPADQGSH
jgi:hypothetical protein